LLGHQVWSPKNYITRGSGEWCNKKMEKKHFLMILMCMFVHVSKLETNPPNPRYFYVFDWVFIAEIPSILFGLDTRRRLMPRSSGVAGPGPGATTLLYLGTCHGSGIFLAEAVWWGTCNLFFKMEILILWCRPFCCGDYEGSTFWLL